MSNNNLVIKKSKMLKKQFGVITKKVLQREDYCL